MFFFFFLLRRPRADLTKVDQIKCAFGYIVTVMFSEHMGPRISRVTLFGEKLRQTLMCNAAGVVQVSDHL